jgi:hypothetical protein
LASLSTVKGTSKALHSRARMLWICIASGTGNTGSAPAQLTRRSAGGSQVHVFSSTPVAAAPGRIRRVSRPERGNPCQALGRGCRPTAFAAASGLPVRHGPPAIGDFRPVGERTQVAGS